MIGRVAGLTLLAGLWTLAPALAEPPPAETVCIQCHSGQGERLAAPVAQWRQSVHAANGISCHNCHGGDPADFANAMSPERGFIGAPAYVGVPDFCGRCHVGVRQDYSESAHGRAVDRGGAQCVVCHGAHNVSMARLDLINEKDCARCHEYGRAGEIKVALASTDARLSALAGDFERLGRLGVGVKASKGKLFDLRNRFHRVFHSVEIGKVRAETGTVQAEAAALQAWIDGHDQEVAKRRRWGGFAIGLLVLMGVLLVQVRHTYGEEERGG